MNKIFTSSLGLCSYNYLIFEKFSRSLDLHKITRGGNLTSKKEDKTHEIESLKLALNF